MIIGVIIPSHGLPEKLSRCLSALYRSKTNDEIIPVIIDNGTPKRFLLETVNTSFPGGHFMYIRLPWNSSFARASNTGMLVCGQADAFLFLNNDCYLDQDCIDRMAWALTLNMGEIIGARLRYPDGTIQHAGGEIIGNWDAVVHRYRGLAFDEERVINNEPVDWVTAACMMVNAKLFVELGGFLEIYENGYEDVDLCLRFRENGYGTFYCAAATAMHEEAQTPGRKDHESENSRIFFNRWRKKPIERFKV